MPQDLPSWAEPYEAPARRSPDGSPPSSNHPTDPTETPYAGPDVPESTPSPAPQTIWPPPGEDCGTCDVSGLTLQIDGETIDCDANPTDCELICCTFPAPDQCAPALESCPVPLSGQWVLLFAAVVIGIYYLRPAP